MDDEGMELLKEASAILKAPGAQLSDEFRREASERIQSYLSSASISEKPWISINESLPELKRRVLVYDALGFGVLTARRGSAGWYLEGELDGYANVTHWMPLPDPPKQ